jgi:outer membrane protein OmpA-like peptidoglycan-associated protein
MALSLIVLALSGAAAAQVKVEGLIKARNGDQMILNTSENPSLVVVLTDSTDVEQNQGMFKARHKNMSMAALIPGLSVKVAGSYNDQQQLVASRVTFNGNDLEQAQSIQAGVHQTQQQTAANQAELEKQNAALKAQNEALEQQQAQLTEQQKALAEQKKQIAANTARFGQMDDYYIWDEVTVLFGNGVVKVDPKYVPQLTALAQKAQSVNGYMIEVQGYASSVGSQAVNQRLSEERANNVSNILLQQGHVPLTRMMAPAAMGESRQIATDKTKEGQAENRRVVVRVLQNKAIAGI